MSASSTATSDEIKFEEQDKVIYHEIVEKLLSIAHYDKNEIIVKVAKEFLGTKYVAGTLEIVPEQLSISLQHSVHIVAKPSTRKPLFFVLWK